MSPVCPSQTQVSGMSTNTVLRELQPDTEYKVTLVPIYTDVEGKRMSENGKTSELDLNSASASASAAAAVATSGSETFDSLSHFQCGQRMQQQSV